MPDTVKQWGLYEAGLSAAVYGNPFLDVTFEAEFVQDHRSLMVRDFYDDEDKYHLNIIDTWNMTIDRIADVASGKVEVELSNHKKYPAVRVVRKP